MPDTDVLKTCPRCEESVKGAAQVCRFCGHEFGPAQERDKGSKSKTAWYILGGCAVVAVAIGIVLAFSRFQTGTQSGNVQSTKAQSTIASVPVPPAQLPAESGANSAANNTSAPSQQANLNPSGTPAPSPA